MAEDLPKSTTQALPSPPDGGCRVRTAKQYLFCKSGLLCSIICIHYNKIGTFHNLLYHYVQAIIVAISSFLCNGIIFGTINSFGVIYVELKKEFDDSDEAAVKASAVGSMAVGFTFFFSWFSGILSDMFGIRRIAFLGGAVAALGLLLTSFYLNNVRKLK